MSEPRRKTFDTVVKALGARVLQFVISTSAVDRDNDTINPKGWDLSAFLRNPIVLWNHQTSEPPIAKCVDIAVTGNGLTAAAEFPTADVYPFGDQIFKLLKGGYLSATSVGFMPTRYERNTIRGGVDIESQELLEWSVVGTPSNRESLIVSRSFNEPAMTRWLGAGRGPVVLEIEDALPQKSGRVLSAGNVALVRQIKEISRAHRADTTGCHVQIDELCNSLLRQVGAVDPDPPVDDSDGDGTRSAGHRVVLELLPEPARRRGSEPMGDPAARSHRFDRADIERAALDALNPAAIRAALKGIDIREIVRLALAQGQGRID